ncbi:YicC family protein [candidate division WOR-3 bacterium]|uniref:YicC family protein n=1 Tax=candidate division WOR-3 bacterium TaxID=2052148 RepID=A0A9D5QCQ7_UNCW3|nr:YicC family protein [candidate division WOR-3 bacterium]MBD3364933.1 YicC family protein [candidate division WOR-3 bacterium]
MITSMTGQGRAVELLKPEGLRLTVEIRSLNHRYLDVSLKLPDQLAGYEEKIKETVKKKIARGSVSISIHLEESNGKKLVLNPEVLDNFLNLIKTLRKRVNVSDELNPEFLLRLPGLIKEEPVEVPTDKLWNRTEKLVCKALTDLVKMRSAEGRNLGKDLRSRLKLVSANLTAIKRRVPIRMKEKRNKLAEIMTELEKEVDHNRFLQEVLYFSERFDIHEECVRLENHISLFSQTLKENPSNGRRLHFTLQEILKETNTIGAKANDTAITHAVISIKEEIEKMREQVQNVE